MEDGNAWTTEKTSLVSSWKPTAMAIMEWQPPGRPQDFGAYPNLSTGHTFLGITSQGLFDFHSPLD